MLRQASTLPLAGRPCIRPRMRRLVGPIVGVAPGQRRILDEEQILRVLLLRPLGEVERSRLPASPVRRLFRNRAKLRRAGKFRFRYA
jgi:hypothetical protein